MCGCAVRTLRAASQGQDGSDPAAGLDASRRPQTGAAWAALYRVEIEEMKRVLAAQDITLPTARFDPENDAELMRFAIAGGILQACARLTAAPIRLAISLWQHQSPCPHHSS